MTWQTGKNSPLTRRFFPQTLLTDAQNMLE